ncbi:hypothetical protein ACFVMC_20250 [Nocardia sp. NPDC127579]|uniref:hypothetical protein n=1 Tax=Nocardia sp. NPDC127579 TaxID=3345402 RepID=UPI00364291B8
MTGFGAGGAAGYPPANHVGAGGYPPQPGGYPIGGTPYPLPPPGNSGMKAALAAIPVVVVLVIGIAVFVVWQQRSEARQGFPWAAMDQTIADTFPGLVSRNDQGVGWDGTTCGKFMVDGNRKELASVKCTTEDPEKVSFIVRQCQDEASAEYHREYGGATAELKHPGSAVPLRVTGDRTDTPSMYIGFPGDPTRALFVIEIFFGSEAYGAASKRKTVGDLIRDWVQTAPLFGR